MVALAEVIASNKRIATSFPDGLIAVFIGGTSGVGEYTVKAFARYVTKPRAYIVGRSEEAADRIINECKKLNAQGHYEFIQADVSLIRNIDGVCHHIQSKESAINILFQSQGSMGFTKRTSEGLPLVAALAVHGRTRFILNLLPLLQNARHLRRVVSVGAGSFEGPIDTDNISGVGFPIRKWRDQFASCITLLLAKVAQQAADVGYVHTCPGVVESGIMRDMEPTLQLRIMVAITGLLAPLLNTSPDECGERQLFAATSARYGHKKSQHEALGVPVEVAVGQARGIDGQMGSGVYSTYVKGESAPLKTERLLRDLKASGVAEKVWQYVLSDSVKVTGKERMM
ncbi:putative short-chain dehydrogenases/reductase [Paraphaeosphaeria sporulosa]|uniref:Putative short-chain dehydrogenases/reductase n=1 Tax=Paraphaeosphaeria sporulosa TaxID=1460663 RepID=A0A177CEX6_9PLEO|nr:putative short-chain dehydrogenases/reductase [Paraphaeosphaeria sporulosa]OAG05866.1 putative short-chain dehydrogenases/reductase [Paraphaeosphaeria sporulosa]